MKPILPTIPSRSTDRKTSRTNLTTLKPAEEFFFLFSFFFSFSLPPKFLIPFRPSFFYSFFLPSLRFYAFLLPSFIYSFVLTFLKIPSYLASNPSLFLLPSLLSFSISFFPTSLLFFFFSPFSFSHRWDNKTWCAEKARVRPCYTHKHHLKTGSTEIKETAPLNPIGILP